MKKEQHFGIYFGSEFVYWQQLGLLISWFEDLPLTS
jgi:hypothetical protein